MKIKGLVLFIAFSLLSCSSAKMVDQWKSQETGIYQGNKVLIIGITPNLDTRKMYEQRLALALEKKGVNAVKSIDFFEKSFSEAKKSQEQLSEIENQLFEAGFDTVLFTTVTGSENKVTAVQSFNDMKNTFGSFMDYYYTNQHVFYQEFSREIYQIYHTETALYCICPGKDRELIWKGSVDIVDPQKAERSVAHYVKVLTEELKKNKLLIID
nr:hypothetical protein [uncultured bacterium]